MTKFLTLVCFAAFLSGCYPDGPTYVSDLDLVATDYDDSFAFSEQSRFFLFDSVVHVADDNSEIVRSFDQNILDQVAQNMAIRNYERVTTLSQADLVITISAWSSTSVNYAYDWWGSWGWGYGGYGPGWGWGYPCCGYTYVTSYTFGTVLIEMSYPAGADFIQQKIPVTWTALVNGMLDGSDASIMTRIEQSIDQSFEQSPYIMAQ